MASKIQLRRDTQANWTSVNPILADGELGIVTDIKNFKIGDGVTAFNDLTYFFESGVDAVGWNDLTAKFSVAAPGVAAPTVADIGNGHRLRRFANGDSMFIEYHVLHDMMLLEKAYPHIHFLAPGVILSGQTVTWDFIYTIARGHLRGDSLTGARTTITLTFTAPRDMVAGEHIIVEGTDEVLQAFDLLEPDTQILAEVKKTGGTYTGDIFGIQADIHYKRDKDATPNKAPDFYA